MRIDPSAPSPPRLAGRRDFLGAAAAFLAALASGAPVVPAFELGVATYSLRKFSRADAIAMLRSLRVSCVNVKEFHLPYKSTPAELAAGVKEFRDAGLKIVAGGSIDLDKDDDDHIRRRFEYAKRCGMPVMVIATTRKILPRIEKFVREYDIKAAIHNHGPEDPEFPSPDIALKLVRGMDRRMGICVDVGHTMRAGADVVECVRAAGSRLFEVHIKDLRSVSDRKSQCPVGQGVAPVVALFWQLRSMKYAGPVSLEYEAEPEDPLPGMALSFAFMRGLLAAMRNA